MHLRYLWSKSERTPLTYSVAASEPGGWEAGGTSPEKTLAERATGLAGKAIVSSGSVNAATGTLRLGAKVPIRPLYWVDHTAAFCKAFRDLDYRMAKLSKRMAISLLQRAYPRNLISMNL